MERNGARGLGKAGWNRQIIWFLGTVVSSVVLTSACIMMGAILALALEGGASQTVGLAVNWAAFVLMVGSYSAAVVLIVNAVSSRTSVPFAVWPALAVFPVAWGLLVASSPGGPYAITPTIVAGVGAAVAWVMIGLRARSARSAISEASEG